jgi:hypothetical protein
VQVATVSALTSAAPANSQPPGDIMSLDTSTLYLVATMIAALLGFMLLFFSYQENISALKWWGTAFVGA